MTNTLQIKLLAAILALLSVIAALIFRGGRHIEITHQDRELQQTLEHKVQPSPRKYLVP
jgi:hypothetical protein